MSTEDRDETKPRPRGPSTRRRALFSLVAALGVYGAIELGAWGMGVVLFRGVRWVPAVHRGMKRVADDVGPLPADRGADPGGPKWRRREILHPYVGFVADQRPSESDPVGPAYGFRYDPSKVGADPRSFVIGIFGGSLAELLAERAGPPMLIHVLEESGQLQERPIEVVNLAMSGYKQPQQLMTLTYFYANGARFDDVVNLDGFNEVVIPPFENAHRGAPLEYPRHWSLEMERLDAEAAARGSAIVENRRRRRAIASLFLRMPLRGSATAALAWQRCDLLLRQEENDDQMWLLQHEGGTGAWTGDGREAEMVGIWARASLQMHRISEANGARYFHFLQPNLHVDGSKLLTADEAKGLSHPFARWAQRGYPLLRAKGAELHDTYGVRFTDLTMAFSDVREPIYVDGCCHIGPAGERLLAIRIADAILKDLGHPMTDEDKDRALKLAFSGP